MKNWMGIIIAIGLFLSAVPLKETGHADVGGYAMIAAIAIAIIFFPRTGSPVKPKPTPEPEVKEVVVRNETHQYNHVVHHNMNYTQVTEATEDAHLLPDGTTVSRRHIKKWH